MEQDAAFRRRKKHLSDSSLYGNIKGDSSKERENLCKLQGSSNKSSSCCQIFL